MRNRFTAALMCSALVSVGATGLAYSDTIGRYECSIVGIGSPEPLGDRAGHGLLSYQFSCYGIDGLLKGAVYSASSRQRVGWSSRQLPVGGWSS